MAMYISALIFSIITSNAKHTYTFQAYVSSQAWNAPGTDDTVYFRLCNSADICGMFTRVGAGWPSWGEEYNYNYVTNQYLGPITKAQIVIEGSDQLCLGHIKVDGREYDPGNGVYCIQDESGGCDTLTVSLSDNNWNSAHTKPCQFAGTLDDTYRPTTSPTPEPTPAPTSQPTDPTKTPTISPTYTTETPTNNPTIEPTTDPTSLPSITPTFSPTEISDSPSFSPTKRPSATPTKAPFRSASVGDGGNGDGEDTNPDIDNESGNPNLGDNAGLQSNGKVNFSETGLIIGIAFGALFLLTVGIFVLYCCHTRKKQRKHLQELKQASELVIGHAIQATNTSPMSERNDTNSSQMSEIPPIPTGTNMEGEDVVPHETMGGGIDHNDMYDPFDEDDDDDVVPMTTPQHIGIQMHISEAHEDAEEIYGSPLEDNISARDSVITKNDTDLGLPPPQIGDEQSSESNNDDMMYNRDKISNGKVTPMAKGNDDDEDMYGM